MCAAIQQRMLLSLAVLVAVGLVPQPALGVRFRGAPNDASAVPHLKVKMNLKKDVTSQKALAAKPKAKKQSQTNCFELTTGDAVTILSEKQRFGNGSFLLSQAGGPSASDKALSVTYEALFDGCGGESTPWFVDVGAGSGHTSALAASRGCRVAAFDPDLNDVRSLSMSQCLNKWQNSFMIFPTMAANVPGGNLKVVPYSSNSPHAPDVKLVNATVEQNIHGLTLDGIFFKGNESKYALDADADGPVLEGNIALLKITPSECCETETVKKTLQGAKKLLSQKGRVKCLATEVHFEESSADVIATLAELETDGYQLAQTGPLSSALEISPNGAYMLYSTNAKQLHDIDDTLRRIRGFDERSGIRAYGSGMSLNREGQYFEYGELVFACLNGFSKNLEVRPLAKARFGDGMWWLDHNVTNGTKTQK